MCFQHNVKCNAMGYPHKKNSACLIPNGCGKFEFTDNQVQMTQKTWIGKIKLKCVKWYVLALFTLGHSACKFIRIDQLYILYSIWCCLLADTDYIVDSPVSYCFRHVSTHIMCVCDLTPFRYVLYCYKQQLSIALYCSLHYRA